MDQALDAIYVYKSTKINNSCNDALHDVSYLKLSKSILQIIFDGFFFRYDELVLFLVYIQYSNSNAFCRKRIELLEYLVFICARDTGVVPSCQLRDWQKASDAFYLNKQTTTICIVRCNLDDFLFIEDTLQFIPASVFSCTAHTKKCVALVELRLDNTHGYFITWF